MKKVIDVNYLRRPELEDYLSKSRDNQVVFTDFACMEVYKHNALNNLPRSLEIVSHYPNRVIVLKGIREIIRLTLNPDVIPEDLIDTKQTKGFKSFCEHTQSSREGNKSFQSELLLKQSLASQYLNDLIKSNQRIIDGIKGFSKSYKPAYLKIIRTGSKLTPDILHIITKHIMYATALLCKQHPDVYSLPEFNWLDNSYIFRHTVSAYFLSLRWIKDGGLDQVGAEKFRNDFVDMSYVTYATYFDGLLSFDKKLIEMYQITLDYLRHFRNPQQSSSVDPPGAVGH